MNKFPAAAAISLCLIFNMGMPMAAFASDGSGDRQPQWVNVSDIILTMNRDGGTVNWTGEINGYSGTTKISATFTLEKRNSSGKYEYVDSWTTSSTNTYLYKAASKTAAKRTYRLSVTATVTRSGITETVTDSLVKTL